MKRGRRRLVGVLALSGLLVASALAFRTRELVLERWYLWRLESGSLEASRHAVEKLGEVGGRRSLEPLLRLVREDRALGAAAVESVARKGGGEAAGKLLEALRFRDAAFRKAAVAPIAARALRDVAWIPALVDLAVREPSGTVSETAREELIKLGRRAVPLLREALRDSRWVIREDEGALEPLENVKGGSSEPVRDRALLVLGTLGPEAAQAVPELIALLSDGWCSGRSSLVLAQIGSPAVPALLEALGDDTLRRRASQALSDMGPAAAPAVPCLIDTLLDTDLEARKAAAMALGSLGPAAAKALPALLAARRDPGFAERNPLVQPQVSWDTEAQFFVMQALGRIDAGRSEAIEALLSSLSGSDHYLHSLSLSELGELGAETTAVVSSLLHLLFDAEQDVMCLTSTVSALSSLGLGKPKLVELVLERLAIEDVSRRRAALRAARALGDDLQPAIPSILGVLKNEADEESASLASAALGALGEQVVPDLVLALRAADPRLRRRAADALGEMHLQDASPVLEALKDLDPGVRRAALKALEHRRQAIPVPALEQFLEDQNPDTQALAARMLTGRKAQASSAVPGLLRLLESPESHVRRWAVVALGEIGAPKDKIIDRLVGRIASNDAALAPETNQALFQLGWLESRAPHGSQEDTGSAPGTGSGQGEDVERTFRWADGLLPWRLAATPFVRVDAGDGKPPEYGFLLEESPERFKILADRFEVETHARSGPRPDRYVVLDLEAEARRSLETSTIPAVSGRLLVEAPRAAWLFAGTAHATVDNDRDALEAFLFAAACRGKGLDDLARRLARAVPYLAGRGAETRGGLRDVIEGRFAQLLFDQALLSLADPEISRKAVLARMEGLAVKCPRAAARDELRRMMDILRKMVREDAEAALGTSAPPQGSRERIAWLIGRLRDQVPHPQADRLGGTRARTAWRSRRGAGADGPRGGPPAHRGPRRRALHEDPRRSIDASRPLSGRDHHLPGLGPEVPEPDRRLPDG